MVIKNSEIKNQATSSPKSETSAVKKEIPQDVLEDLIKVNPSK